MRKLIAYLILSFFTLIGFGQEANEYNDDSSKWIIVHTKVDSVVMSDDFKHIRCKNNLSDSLSILLSSLQNPVHKTTYDTTIHYTYQFTKTVDIEVDFQSKLSSKRECFVIENERSISEFNKTKKYILYEENEWLVVVISGIPRIGNSTYITDSYLYFRKD